MATGTIDTPKTDDVRFLLRLPRDLRKRFKLICVGRDVVMNDEIVKLIEREVDLAEVESDLN